MREELIYDIFYLLNIIGCRDVKFEERHLDIHWVDDLDFLDDNYNEEE